MREFNDPDQLETASWETIESGDHRGGQFYQIYLSDPEDPFFVGSELYWLDENVMITAYSWGPGNERLDLETLQDRFVDELDDLVATTL